MANEAARSRLLLIVEDDKFLADLLVGHLAKEGFDIELAFDGEKGLEKARERRPDLVILDLLLPGINGFEVLERLKKDPELAKIPVIILSNLGRKEEIERGLLFGAEDFIVKARFDLDEITEKIKKFLEKRSNQSEK